MVRDTHEQKDANCHFVVVVPFEWDEGIIEEIIRPIFVEANLISKADGPGRLLFVSKLDCTLPFLTPYDNTFVYGGEKYNRKGPDLSGAFKKGFYYLFCETNMKRDEDVLSIKCDAFEIVKPYYSNYSPGFDLAPIFLRSKIFKIDLNEEIKAEFYKYLVRKEFDSKYQITQDKAIMSKLLDITLDYFAAQNRVNYLNVDV